MQWCRVQRLEQRLQRVCLQRLRQRMDVCSAYGCSGYSNAWTSLCQQQLSGMLFIMLLSTWRVSNVKGKVFRRRARLQKKEMRDLI
jgi:hypothetical protein